jgi:ubiquinone/menaquinone biosynthesis C-methylase UbiE
MLDRVYRRFLTLINEGRAPSWLQKSVWWAGYQILARRWSDPAWTFMNYGWLPEAGAPPFALDPADEANRNFIGLYHLLATAIPLRGARVLEVGSGRGGGSSWLARAHAPAEMVGIDFSPAAVALANRLHGGVPNLRFQTGDAENLPFADASFDAVVNVESSHCYGDMPRFVAEVARVLKPGGLFGWADIRGQGMIPATERAFHHPDLSAIDERDIADGVVRALDASNDIKQALTARMWFGGVMRQFSGTKGSMIYGALRNGNARYMLKILERRRA